ncbi:hypothetical protein PGT21_031945 [Puccinia graminis f. sp. tritici]|uniref:Uncharacterized protein n=1 Tax=Puccinia graminis f. sp. tritici TaxID=56615 RepID=A0A5B0QY90_PUCGR|nr:hypothetical protein PGT21_031945 [Puccinia graminis f. sp. tritici]
MNALSPRYPYKLFPACDLSLSAPATRLHMAAPSGSIRTYQHPNDHKYLRFLIGSTILTKTAIANQTLFWSNPLVYLWTTLFTLYIALDRLNDNGQLSLLSTILIRLPFLFAPPLILLVLLNRANRTYFHSILLETLSREDLRDPLGYYDRRILKEKDAQIPSGIWVLDYDGRQLGVVAFDQNLEGYEELSSNSDSSGSATARRTVLIRHLACASDFRSAGIDEELLQHVRRLLFHPNSPSVNRIAIPILNPIDPFLKSALLNQGFRPLRITSSQKITHPSKKPFLPDSLLGLLGWPDCHSKWTRQLWILDRQSAPTDQNNHS